MSGKFLAGLLCILLTGCAATNMTGGPDLYIPLQDSVRMQIGSTSVYLGQNPANDNNVVTQTMASPQQTGAGQAGVIGVLIGSIIGSMIVSENENERQQKQHASMAIHEALIKYNFASKVRAELQHQVSAQGWLHAEDVQKEPKFLSGDYSRLAAQVNTDAILIFDTYYSLSPDLKTLSVVANVVLYPVSKQLKSFVVDKTSDKPALFHNRYTIEFTESETKHVTGSWTRNDRLRKALDMGIPALIRTAIADLNHDAVHIVSGVNGIQSLKGIEKITRQKSGEYKLIGSLASL